MSILQAILVGIDEYSGLHKSVPGPGMGAIAIAKWLLSLSETDLQIDLFLTPSAALQPEIDKLSASSKVMIHTATFETITKFMIEGLERNQQQAERLFIYWAGHGLTSPVSDHRYFYPGDYSELRGNAFNATNYLRQLRTQPFQHLRKQIFIADVCGVYRAPKKEEQAEHRQIGGEQLAYVATKPGIFAPTGTEGGAFTLKLLSVLKNLGMAWFDLPVLNRAIGAAFESCVDQPYLLSGWMDQQPIPLVGKQKGNVKSPAYLRDARRVLAQCDAETIYQPHYERTVMSLYRRPLASTLAAALDELASMRDATLDEGVSFGLLEFMMRLQTQAGMSEPIGGWLERHASQRKNARQKISGALSQESKQRILLLEVVPDTQGKISHFKPYLCRPNGDFVSGSNFPECKVAGWDDMVEKLQALFLVLAPDEIFGNLDIHFAVDPPLFDLPFHVIPVAPNGVPIGRLAVVVLRHRTRMFSEGAHVAHWKRCARALRAQSTDTLTWQGIAPPPTLLPDQPGLYFSTQALSASASANPTNILSKSHLKALLLLGAPCLFIPQTEPKDANWSALEQSLNKWLPPSSCFDGIAENLRDQRIRGEPLALGGALLWDDPRSNPFKLTGDESDHG